MPTVRHFWAEASTAVVAPGNNVTTCYNEFRHSAEHIITITILNIGMLTADNGKRDASACVTDLLG